MSTSSRNEARTAWREARTLADLCALGAQFLTGRLAFFPGWGSPTVDEETDHLLPHLMAFHRAGWFTLASQPGARNVRSHDHAVEVQRAFVCGFAGARVAERIAGLAVDTELCVAIFAPGERGGHRVPVTVCGSEARVFAGYCAVAEELDCLRDHCCDAALDALSRAHYVCVIDLCWERDAHLWPKLAAVLCESPESRSSAP